MTQTALTREQVLNSQVGFQLDGWFAEHVMGWSMNENGVWWADKDGVTQYAIVQFRPSLHISIVWETEGRFAKYKDLSHKYAHHLNEIVNGTEIDSGQAYYNLAHATPEHRCKAALLAVLDI